MAAAYMTDPDGDDEGGLDGVVSEVWGGLDGEVDVQDEELSD